MATIGLDVGATYIHAVVLHDDDRRGELVRMRTPAGDDRGQTLEVIDAAVHTAAGEAGIPLADVPRIGVGTPGVVMDGTVGGASNLPGWDQRFSLREGLEQRLDRPVRVVNDVTAAAAAEHRFGAAVGADDVLAVFVGTGVGGGLVLDGRAYEGAFGGAGEFGHTVVTMGGAVCPCGRRGCVEAYAGRRAIENAIDRAIAAGVATIVPTLVAERGQGKVSSGVIRDALQKGDPLVADLLDDAIDALGAGIASAVNLLDVEVVVVGGGLADKLGPAFLHRIESAMRPNLFLVPAKVRVVPATLADQGTALGAALLARG